MNKTTTREGWIDWEMVSAVGIGILLVIAIIKG